MLLISFQIIRSQGGHSVYLSVFSEKKITFDHINLLMMENNDARRVFGDIQRPFKMEMGIGELVPGVSALIQRMRRKSALQALVNKY